MKTLKDEVIIFPLGERLIPEEKVKEAVLKFEKWLNENVEYQESNRLFDKFKEIFGDWEE